MKKNLYINSVYGIGSTGKIVKNLSCFSQKNNFDCYSIYGREKKEVRTKEKYIGNTFYFYLHILFTRLFDMHGRCSFHATKKLIKHIELIQPDIIHLHNIHGCYLNYEILFMYPKSKKSFIYRLFYEYIYFYFISIKVRLWIWLSLHDMTPFVFSKEKIFFTVCARGFVVFYNLFFLYRFCTESWNRYGLNTYSLFYFY